MLVLESGRKRRFSTVAFNADATLLAAGGTDGPVVVWNLATRAVAHRVRRNIWSPSQLLAFHPRASRLYIPGKSGLTAFDTDTGESREVWPEDVYARTIAVDLTGRYLIGAWHRRDDHNHKRLTCLDLTRAEHPSVTWERAEVDHNEGWTSHVAFFADGERFAATETDFDQPRSDGPRLVIRATPTGDALCTIHGPGADAEHLTVSPRGNAIVTGRANCLYVFNPESEAGEESSVVREIRNTAKHHFTGIAFHPSGRYLAATSNDATVKLYDTTTWEVARTFTWNIGPLRCVAFSFDGALAAAASNTDKVVIWDVDL